MRRVGVIATWCLFMGGIFVFLAQSFFERFSLKGFSLEAFVALVTAIFFLILAFLMGVCLFKNIKWYKEGKYPYKN